MGYARIAARHFGVRLHEYYVTPDDVLAAVPQVAGAYDEPFGNASAVPAWYCARMARQDGKHALLAGDGGDEIFGGNARYAKQKMFAVFDRVPTPLRALAGTLPKLPGGMSIPLLRKLGSYVGQARVPMPDRLESYNFLHRTPLAEIFTKDFLSAIDSGAPLAGLREVYLRTASADLLKRMLHLDLKITLADNDLRKVKRMCALAGVDVSFPMLDEALVEFAARVPSALLLRRYELRWFYKHALRNFLPAETLAKSKHGFGLPFGVWMTEHAPLRELACDSLAALRTRGWLKPEYLDRLIQQHRSGDASYYGVMVWVLMMLQQWLDTHGR
jgi:asparagine synthase (glutamine-hydrolysing)